jgi:hypothetical protein
MKMSLARVMALVLVLSSAAQAQSLSELMEKAIYTEETLGNVEGAIRLYEQIVNGSIPGTDVRQLAQRRLTSARDHLRNRPTLPLGIFDGHTYRHTRTGLTFTVPPRWIMRGTNPSSDNGEMVRLTAVAPEADMGVWMIPEANDAASINEKLDGSPAMKMEDRGARLPNYRYRPESIRRLVINGKPAMMAIADFGDEKPYVEFLTWIYTERTHTFFFAEVEAQHAAAFQPRFERLLQSTNIP